MFCLGAAGYGSSKETPASPPAGQRSDRPDGGQHLLHHPAASSLHNGPQCGGTQSVLHRGEAETCCFKVDLLLKHKAWQDMLSASLSSSVFDSTVAELVWSRGCRSDEAAVL